MYRRSLVIAIYMPKWFMEVLNILKRRNIDYTVYRDPDSIPYYSVVYTDFYYFVERIRKRNDLLVIYDPDNTCYALEKSILATQFKDKYHELIIGIDPGRTPYVVVLGDDNIIDYGRISMEKIEAFISNCIKCYPHERIIVRVGGGYNGWKVILRIRDKFKIPMEIVDEEETTPRNRRTDDPILLNKTFKKLSRYRDKDAYAALKIALRKGIEVT